MPQQAAGDSHLTDSGDRSRAGNGLGTYFVLTYAISWLAWGTLAVLRIPGGSVSPEQPAPPLAGLLLLAIGGFSPSVVGLLMT